MLISRSFSLRYSRSIRQPFDNINHCPLGIQENVMFATIRAKLLGFGFVSLLSIVLVGVGGYYGYHVPSGALADSQGRFDAVNTQLRAELAQDAMRSDVLLILRAAKSGDQAAYEDRKSTRLNSSHGY